MDVAVAATLYFSFCAFLIFPLFGAPAIFSRMAITLCGYELAVTTGYVAAQGTCDADCSPAVGALRSMAGLEVPTLTGLMFIIAIVYAVFAARSW